MSHKCFFYDYACVKTYHDSTCSLYSSYCFNCKECEMPRTVCLALSTLVCSADGFYLTVIDIIRTSVYPYELLHPHVYPVTETEVPGTSEQPTWWQRMEWVWFVNFGSAVLVNPVLYGKFWNGIDCHGESWSLPLYG